MIDRVGIQRGRYFDSVRLMQASAAAEASPGVERALVAMATDLNRSLLTGLGFTAPEGLGPDDLIVAIRAADEAAATTAIAAAEAALAPAPAASGGPLRGAAAGPGGRRWRGRTWPSSRCPAPTPSSRRWTPCTPGCR